MIFSFLHYHDVKLVKKRRHYYGTIILCMLFKLLYINFSELSLVINNVALFKFFVPVNYFWIKSVGDNTVLFKFPKS